MHAGLCDAQQCDDCSSSPCAPGQAAGLQHKLSQPPAAAGNGNGCHHDARLSPSALLNKSASTLDAIRAMSLHVGLPDAAAAALAKQPALHFPPVAVVFVAVEGSEQLQQAKYPGMG